MSSYVTYYLLWMVVAYAANDPRLLLGLVLFFALRSFIPDPGAIGRAFSRSRALSTQVRVNPANVVARRDLATIYLDLLRPRAALALVEAALLRAPDDPDLLFLSGVALHRIGRHEEALAPLVRCVEGRLIRYGEPYFVAGEALFALGRMQEAIDAYQRYARVNHSDVRVHVRLARAFDRTGDRAAVRAALDMAVETWTDIPGAMRRRAFGYWLSAQWLRARLLGDPFVIGVGLALVLVVGAVGWSAAPRVRAMAHRASESTQRAR